MCKFNNVPSILSTAFLSLEKTTLPFSSLTFTFFHSDANGISMSGDCISLLKFVLPSGFPPQVCGALLIESLSFSMFLDVKHITYQSPANNCSFVSSVVAVKSCSILPASVTASNLY